ncbi:hypothetical protein EDF24_1241 [Curtobacterium sp. PhB130]|nr:hypothetical protein EDF24_1241 [Curtobacterium sp. PhB130]
MVLPHSSIEAVAYGPRGSRGSRTVRQPWAVRRPARQRPELSSGLRTAPLPLRTGQNPTLEALLAIAGSFPKSSSVVFCIGTPVVVIGAGLGAKFVQKTRRSQRTHQR